MESCYSDPKRRYTIWLQSESFVWSVWFIRFIRSVWVNQTNETNQIDEIDRMSQAPKSAQV